MRTVDRRASLVLATQVFALNHIVLLIVSYLTGKLFFDALGHPRSIPGLWHRWDVLWYIRIADHGYHWYRPPVQSDLAFFPLFPAAIHLLTIVSPLSAYAAGLLIANVCFFIALYLLHRLVTHDFGEEVANRSVYYLGIFPTALFFFTAYAEALFLACCLGCFYALRLRRWYIAGLCGLAAALTRQVGVLLIVPAAIEYMTSRREHGVPWRSLSGLAPVCLILLGPIAFMAYLKVVFGDPLLFMHAQTAWGRSFEAPWTAIQSGLNSALSPDRLLPPHTQVAIQTLGWLDFSFMVLFLALVAYCMHDMPLSYGAYAAVVMLVILVNPVSMRVQPLALMSISRFEVTLFPPFIALGLLGRSRAVDRVVPVISVALLALFTVLFVRGRWIA